LLEGLSIKLAMEKRMRSKSDETISSGGKAYSSGNGSKKGDEGREKLK